MAHIFKPGDRAYWVEERKWITLQENNDATYPIKCSTGTFTLDGRYVDKSAIALLPLNPYDPTDPLNPPEFRYPFFLNGRPVRVGDELNVIGFIKPHTVIALSIESDKCLCSVTDCSPLELSYKYFSWPLEPVKKKTTYLWAIPVAGMPGEITIEFKRMTAQEAEKYWNVAKVPGSEQEE